MDQTNHDNLLITFNEIKSDINHHEHHHTNDWRIYYMISPYQNCVRALDKRIEDVRNQLATETDVTKRDELELENKNLISQKKSECSDQFRW